MLALPLWLVITPQEQVILRLYQQEHHPRAKWREPVEQASTPSAVPVVPEDEVNPATVAEMTRVPNPSSEARV